MSMSVSQPLSKYNVLKLDRAELIQDRLSKLYNDTSFVIEPVTFGQPVKLNLNATPMGSISLNSIQFPLGVKATAPRLNDKIDFTSTVQGGGRAKIGGKWFSFDRDRIFVLSPYDGFNLDSSEGFTSVIVSVPRYWLEAQLRALTGCESIDALRFDPDVDRSRQPVADVWRFVDVAVAELEQETSAISNPLVFEQLTESLLTGLLYAQPHNYSHLLFHRVPGNEPKYVRMVEEYIHAHCQNHLKAQDLAALTGISMSSLYAGFRRFRGYSPMQFLKQVRLDRIRNELLVGSPEKTIKDVASRWGFTHLGRFSAAYEERFGELPSHTLSRATH
jgi:AraC-like DNA-binding protein